MGKRNGTVPTPLHQPPRSSRRPSKQELTARIAPYQWKPGQSGNPVGRRKNPIGATIRAFLEECETLRSGEKLERKQRLIRKLYRLAVFDGDMSAAKLLVEYGYGKPVQPIELDDASLRTWAEAVSEHFNVPADDVLRHYRDKERFRAAADG